MNTPKPPPFLLGAALAFWGWQSGYITVGIVLGLIIELPRWVKVRWEISREEFSRIWVFCTLLLLAGVVYAFTLNEGPSRFAEMFQDPDLRNQSRVGLTGARTAAVLIRWVPMIFFLFVAAQHYSAKGGVPVEIVSLILRRRWKKARKNGQPPPPSRLVDVSYVYFILCLFSASIHGEEARGFFVGAGLLSVWALYPFRSPRFHIGVWAGAVGAAVALAWAGQHGLSTIQRYLESINPQWLTSFQRGRFEANQAKTSLGQIGRIQSSPRIVIRVHRKDGPVPQYLREASYNGYRGATWFSSDLEREFERVDEEPPGGNFALVPGKTNIAKVEISCFLPGRHGLLPLPLTTGRLTNLPAFLLEKNPYGAIHVQGPGLVIFDALYGPGPLVDSPPSEMDVSVPEREEWALDEIIRQLELEGKTKDEVLDKLENFFTSEFTYSLYQGRQRRERILGTTPVSRFLLQTRTGHCEYFATSAVLLLHRLGIPARYAVGYVVHEEASADHYVVRQRDAHSWCLVWDENRQTWRDFDPTPPTWDQAAGPPSLRQRLSDAWSRIKFEFLRIRWGQTRLREYILWIVIPILCLLLLQIIFSRRRRVRQANANHRHASAWPGLDSEFYLLEKKLGKKGFVRLPSEPMTAWLLRGAQSIPAFRAEQDSLRQVLRLHYRYRFDPEGLTETDRELLRQHARRLLDQADRTEALVAGGSASGEPG